MEETVKLVSNYNYRTTLTRFCTRSAQRDVIQSSDAREGYVNDNGSLGKESRCETTYNEKYSLEKYSARGKLAM